LTVKKYPAFGNKNFCLARESPIFNQIQNFEFKRKMSMKRKKIHYVLTTIFIVLIIVAVILFFNYMKVNKKELLIRPPAVAGAFYPADKNILARQIDDFLSQTEEAKIEDNLKMLILPHAGYDYSGPVAAYGFKQLAGKNFKTVILIGPSHQDWFFGAALANDDYWQTPLGKVQIDKELGQKLSQEDKNIFIREQAHQNEHCLELMLPFLQKVLKDFKVMPIIISQADDKFLSSLAQTIKKHLSEDDLVIISSDLSHYPAYEDAQRADQKTIQGILSGSVQDFEKAVQENMAQELPNLDTCACGEEPIKAGLYLAREMGWNKIKLLNYANSGDSSGDLSRVVGYAAIAFNNNQGVNKETLTLAEKQTLLKIARQSIENQLNGKKTSIDDGDLTEQLKQPQGAFVTLNKNDQLRGCMGRIIEEKEPLYQVVAEMAKVAAFEDPRFYPVAKEEIKEINIEISVLSPLEKITDPFKEIEVGKHGVIVSARGGSTFGGQKGGVFLPQVATENNWDLETFMNELCEHKANLPRNAWKTGDVDLYVFSAEVFGE